MSVRDKELRTSKMNQSKNPGKPSHVSRHLEKRQFQPEKASCSAFLIHRTRTRRQYEIAHSFKLISIRTRKAQYPWQC
eukprot:767435-Hanusia_phi.AAC.8